MDGRRRLDARQVVIETGVVSQTSGSARCRVTGGTDVLVGIKCEIGNIEAEDSDRGRVVCNVECSPSASQQYEGKGADEINNELTQIMNRFLGGSQSGIDLVKLCIVPGQHCWVINIDAMILDYGGNAVDALFIATRAALFNTRIPKTVVQDVGDGQVEFEVLDDVEQADRLEGMENIPLCVTVNRLGLKYIIDATPYEELCTEARLHIAVNPAGELCGVQKGGDGGIQPDLFREMVQTARTLGQAMIKKLDQRLKEEEEDVTAKREKGVMVEKLGFFAELQ
ncbi:uncharacterized protein VTP21DRAFT_6204 [Calcarisporiella thermophila]|uniref:uncharacterized protein n=1 Tax=Calcarisporiella thermophila TaxID=911321 RepID=UPI00374470F9